MDASLAKLWTALKKWFGREPPPAPVRLERPIESALDDAQVLLAFSAQGRRAVEPGIIGRLTKARQDVLAQIAANQPIDPAVQSAFWAAYDELALAAAPLSAHSIRSSLRINVTRFPVSLFTPPAVLAVVAIGVFFLCIVIQSFWVSGKELLDKADALDAQRVELHKQIARAEAGRKAARTKIAHQQARICKKGGPCVGAAASPASGAVPSPVVLRKLSPEESAEVARLDAQQEVLAFEAEEREAAIDGYTLEIREINERGEALAILLGRWHERVTIVCTKTEYLSFLCLSNHTADREQVDRRRVARDLARAALETWEGDRRAAPPAWVPALAYSGRLTSQEHRFALERGRLQAAIQDAERTLAAAQAASQRQTAHEVRIILGTLATYVVPLFMGLLGSLAFVLQTLTTQLRDHTYEQLSASASIVRLCLGAIAGVFGGLVTPATDAMLKGLPPLFIPFVFGYGIEILFSLLNRIVRTFTQGEGAARPAAA